MSAVLELTFCFSFMQLHREASKGALGDSRFD